MFGGMAMKTTRLDIVTVVHSADLRLLALQARSLARYADPAMVGTIHIIVNDQCFRAVRRRFLREVLPEYGGLSAKVRLWHSGDLWPEVSRKSGWGSQQALKLMAANVVETEDFLILDAKNHFIRPTTVADFIAEDGRLRTQMYRIHSKFTGHFKRACAYFGYGSEPDLTTGLPTSTPFLMKRSIVRAMMAEIEAREAVSFQSFFMKDRLFTEFYLYYGYILARYRGHQQFYEKRYTPTATLFGGHAKDARQGAEILAQLDRPDVYCMGVHRAVLKQADPQVINLVTDTWARFGLVTDTKEQTYFTTVQNGLPKWRRYLPF
ncbi:DUF6492 family protein [Kordiimonas lacus]|uniref:Uncharacterized protein n=1 Tax=Kordiimonas lacus TaxID=637679 RepID=A0A1G6TNW6_9PROT|nr:DUF6492 family protein [Kordiimonas lacus]SDD30793.1 hypothetical protein SAMN04488071_0302 [Kordiimonas lacus]